jgi:hypothetical protein
MHRILLHEVVIDVPADRFAATQEFWAAALSAEPRVIEQYPEFTGLIHAAALSTIGLQRLESGAPRVHLDIETDDLAAEVDRLVRLGAHEVARPHDWVILQDPAGLPFCVLPAHTSKFAEHAREVE